VIVAIEAASTDVSLAAADDSGQVRAVDGWEAGHRHSAELLPRLEAMLAGLGWALGDVRLVVVGAGPGSFTGLRVAMSLGKGMAAASGARIRSAGSLDAWLAADKEAEAAVVRAGASESYLLPRDGELAIVAHDDMPASLRARPAAAPRELAALLGLGRARPPHAAAGALIGLALAAPADDNLDRLEPRYLRAPRGAAIGTGEERVRWL
jgi:tRNA threonylcarbamoyl adenosine modification protein YeaZ